MYEAAEERRSDSNVTLEKKRLYGNVGERITYMRKVKIKGVVMG